MNALVEVLLLTLERLGIARGTEATTCLSSPSAPALPLALVASLNGKVNVRSVLDPLDNKTNFVGGGFIVDLTSGLSEPAVPHFRQALHFGTFVAALAREDILQNPDIMSTFRQAVGPRVIIFFGGAQLVWLVASPRSRVQTADPATAVQFLAAEVVLWNTMPLEHIRAVALGRVASCLPLTFSPSPSPSPLQTFLPVRPGGQWQQSVQSLQTQLQAPLQFQFQPSPSLQTQPQSHAMLLPQQYFGPTFVHSSPPNSPGTSSASTSEPHSPLATIPPTNTTLAALASVASTPMIPLLPTQTLPPIATSTDIEVSRGRRRRTSAVQSTGDSDEESLGEETSASPTGMYLKGVHAAQQGKALESAIKKHKSTLSKRQVLTDVCKMKYRSAQRKLRIAKFIQQWPEISNMTQRAAERYISEQLKKAKKNGIVNTSPLHEAQVEAAPPAILIPVDMSENGHLLPPNTIPMQATVHAPIKVEALSSLALAAAGTV